MSIFRPMFACLLFCAVTSPASAHIVFAEPTATAGGSYVGFLRVSHGCAGSNTRSIRVEIPASILSARPQPKPGWTLAVEKQPLKQPMKSESGQPITERVSAVTWTGDLPADQFDQFGLMVKLSMAAGPVYFPTTQTCAIGRNDWINVPPTPEDWHRTPSPAPMLMATKAGMTDMKM